MTTQIVRVDTGTMDGNEDGVEWRVYYVLLETHDDNNLVCYELYIDDGAGNGDHVCTGYNKQSMVTMTLRLGKFVEWEGTFKWHD